MVEREIHVCLDCGAGQYTVDKDTRDPGLIAEDYSTNTINEELNPLAMLDQMAKDQMVRERTHTGAVADHNIVPLYFFFFNEAPISLKQREKTLHIGFQIMTRLMQNKAEIPFMNAVDPILLGVVCLFIASKLDEMDD